MTRDELLDQMAKRLENWPTKDTPRNEVPVLPHWWAWECQDGEDVIAIHIRRQELAIGERDVIKRRDELYPTPEEDDAWQEAEARIDRIAQSDGSGEHYDAVDRPAHYQSDDGIECIDAIRAALGLEGFVAHCRGTAIKYAWRSGKKAAHAEDLRKACVYLTWAAEAMEEVAK